MYRKFNFSSVALSENPILPEHTNDVKIDVWNVDVQIDEMFGKQSGCIPKNSTGTIASSEMMKVREITEREKCKSSSKTMKCDESKPSTCSVKGFFFFNIKVVDQSINLQWIFQSFS